jgi:hypothetical protein
MAYRKKNSIVILNVNLAKLDIVTVILVLNKFSTLIFYTNNKQDSVTFTSS